MKRSYILARDESGTQVVILKIESGANTEVPPSYELPNRSKVERISETQFVVVETGRVLTKLKA